MIEGADDQGTLDLVFSMLLTICAIIEDMTCVESFMELIADLRLDASALREMQRLQETAQPVAGQTRKKSRLSWFARKGKRKQTGQSAGDPFLGFPMSEMIAEQRLETIRECEKLKASNTLWRRCRWTHRHRQDFIEGLHSLRLAMNDLQTLLRLRNPDLGSDPRFAAKGDNVREVKTKARRIQDALSEAHQCLKANGIVDKTHRIDVQLVNDFEELRDEVRRSYADLRPETVVISVLDRSDQQQENNNRLFHLEIEADKLASKKPEVQEYLSSLEKPSSIASKTDNESLDLWGYVKGTRKDSEERKHAVFADIQARWTACGNLRDGVEDAAYLDVLNPLDVIELALLLAFAFLYFVPIPASASGVRLENITFHSARGKTQKDLLAENGRLILKPWLQVSFGQNPSLGIRGEREQTCELYKEPRTALALLLYSVGCGRSISYNAERRLLLTKHRVRTDVERGVLNEISGQDLAKWLSYCLILPQRQLLVGEQMIATSSQQLSAGL